MAMNQDPISANSGSRQSPSRGYVSPGSDSRPKSSQKRASRAGTRSVTTLSAAQLERKRANDREAQRAIRQRTKDHIESLERRINELNVMNETREKVMVATQQRNRELEQEVSYLRSRLGNDVFTLSVSEAEGKGGMHALTSLFWHPARLLLGNADFYSCRQNIRLQCDCVINLATDATSCWNHCQTTFDINEQEHATGYATSSSTFRGLEAA